MFEELMLLRRDDRTSFHVPGHKFGRLYDEEFKRNVLDIDFTEVPGSDNLHDPRGMIARVQEKAARHYGAIESYMLVNGTTSGIHASILATSGPGDSVLAFRDCHRSVFTGIILSGADMVLMDTVMTPDMESTVAIDIEALREKLEGDESIKSVVVTYPGYYGYGIDIGAVSEAVRAAGRILIVDSAHGSHFNLSDELPPSPVESGAHIVVNSLHKTLLAMTGGSLLHVCSDGVDRQRLRFYLASLQTSSPSYPIMASIDRSLDVTIARGDKLADELIANLTWLYGRLGDMGIRTHFEIAGAQAKYRDITRIVLPPLGSHGTGYETERVLRERYGIFAEMASRNAVVMVATIGSTRRDFENLAEAVSRETFGGRHASRLSKAATAAAAAANDEPGGPTLIMESPVFAMTMKEAVSSARVLLPVRSVERAVSADFIIPYPPGIPSVFPGQSIGRREIDGLVSVAESGGSVIGLELVDGEYHVSCIPK